MTMQIAVIDPYMKSPAIHCFNGLVELAMRPMSYHQPSQSGTESLLFNRNKYSAYVVLGSASHVHEDLSWHRPLADFLLEELKANKPVLGCCFGHQLICHALGSRVRYYRDENTKLQGMRSVKITNNFWNFLKGEEFNLAVTHKQIVSELASGLVAVGEGLINDLVIHKDLPFMGVQAHPEASHHFYNTEIQSMHPDQQILAKTDGNRIILRFFKHFNLI